MQGGQVVYDATQGVYWLADANLASHTSVRAQMNVSGIDPNGAMDFQTALAWVGALNAASYLGHNNWQLPVTPKTDSTCDDTGSQGGSFGPGCQASALGNLFYVGLKASYPDGVLPNFTVAAPRFFQNMALSYYWAAQNDGGQGNGSRGGGQEMFSFVNNIKGGTTKNDIYYYVLPKYLGYVGSSTAPPCKQNAPTVSVYSSGEAAGQAIYDCATQTTWPIDANLAETHRRGFSGTVSISDNNGPLTPPKINHGAMLFATAQDWIKELRNDGYLTVHDWELPANSQDFLDLVGDIELAPGDPAMMSTLNVGPFQNLQPFFYWGCQRGPKGSSQSPCPAAPTTQIPATGYAPPARTSAGLKAMAWSFDFGHGVQSTSAIVQKYFVMVYYVDQPPPPRRCNTPIQCCIAAGGQWGNGRCQ
ncbi:MAG TPA: hypothetical protein VN814_25055 [Caulobacteraceae bacterium]|nr:hypothetical protein [Caulobacteraceae bacterium]